MSSVMTAEPTTPGRWDALLVGRRAGAVLWAATLGALVPPPVVRRTDEAGWGGSLVVHLAWLLVAVGVCVLAPMALESYAPGIGYGSDYTRVRLENDWGPLAVGVEILSDLSSSGFRSTWDKVLLVAALVVLWIEGPMLAAAWIGWGWAARPDERVRASFGRALRRAWRLTPGLVVFMLGMSVFHAAVDSGIEWLNSATVFPSVNGYYYEDREWYRLHWTLLSLGWLCASGIAVVVLLWSMLPWGDRRRSVWPAGCSGCGYPMLDVSEERGCPECGRPRSQTLGESVRPGTPWQRARGWARLGAWARTAALATFRPREFGRRYQATGPWRSGASPAGALAMGLAVLLVVGAVGFASAIGCSTMLVNMLDPQPYSQGVDRMSDYVDLAIAGAWVLAGCSLFFVVVVGTLVSAVQSVVLGRNVMGAASASGVFLLPFLAAWSVGFWMLGGVTGVVSEVWIDPMPYQQAELFRTVLICVMIAYPVIGLVGVLSLQGRAAAGARYANW